MTNYSYNLKHNGNLEIYQRTPFGIRKVCEIADCEEMSSEEIEDLIFEIAYELKESE